MNALYKYLRYEHAQRLLKEGIFRIGTLYEYRDIEKHGKFIGDQNEGKKSLYMTPNYQTWTDDFQPKFGKEFFHIGKGASVSFQGVTLEKSFESPNYYIYSTTSVFDENALVDFGYDTCIVITTPKEFFAALNRIMRHKAIFEGFFPCQYMSRRVHHSHENSNIHPALIKSPEYANQKEVRALWRPKKKKAEPVIIKCQKASKFCRLL